LERGVGHSSRSGEKGKIEGSNRGDQCHKKGVGGGTFKKRGPEQQVKKGGGSNPEKTEAKKHRLKKRKGGYGPAKNAAKND